MEFLPWAILAVITLLLSWSLNLFYRQKALASRYKEKLHFYSKKNSDLRQKLDEANEKLKSKPKGDTIEQGIYELASDMKTRGYSFLRIDPDNVLIRK